MAKKYDGTYSLPGTPRSRSETIARGAKFSPKTPPPPIVVSDQASVNDSVYTLQITCTAGEVQNEAFVELQLANIQGRAAAKVVKLDMAVFADEDRAEMILDDSVYFFDASVGEILTGEDDSPIRLKTDATGKFKCKVRRVYTNSVAYVGCSSGYMGVVIDTENTATLVPFAS